MPSKLLTSEPANMVAGTQIHQHAWYSLPCCNTPPPPPVSAIDIYMVGKKITGIRYTNTGQSVHGSFIHPSWSGKPTSLL